MGLPSSFFDGLLFNKLDSIDWQSFKVADPLKKEWQKGKQNQKNACRVKNSLKCRQKLTDLLFSSQRMKALWLAIAFLPRVGFQY